tara:strand:- start:304 stop:819 length:516 start_codon:yes stop_codon:yes gene_type:complete
MRKKDKNECTICKRKFTGDYRDNMGWSTFGHQENEYSICNLCWGSTSNSRLKYERKSDGTLVFIGTLWDYSNFWRRTARQPYKVAVRECSFCDKTHAFYWRLNRGYSGDIIPEFEMHGRPVENKTSPQILNLPPIEDVLDNLFPEGSCSHSVKMSNGFLPPSKKIKREKKT